MQVHRSKWNLSREVDAEHHHARHPEKQDVVARDEHTGWIVALEVWRLRGPTQRRKRPQSRAEPRIEHVRILLQVFRPTSRAGARRFSRYGHVAALRAVPRRDSVSPPELPRKRPVADISHPEKIFLAPVLRNHLDFAALDCRQRWLGERLHRAEPLRGDSRLHDALRTFTQTHGVRMVNDFLKQSLRLQVFDEFLSRLA